MEFFERKEQLGKSDTGTYSKSIIKNEHYYQKNFALYFLVIFATIVLFDVFCLNVGAKAPGGQHTAKSK